LPPTARTRWNTVCISGCHLGDPRESITRVLEHHKRDDESIPPRRRPRDLDRHPLAKQVQSRPGPTERTGRLGPRKLQHLRFSWVAEFF
jgi:hypothetical protein